MANMPKTNKRRIHIRVDLDVCRKVIKTYRKKTDTDDNLSFVRCLEDAVRDIDLTAEDWKMIYEEEKHNEELRKKGKSK